jgi:hypothetical protein
MMHQALQQAPLFGQSYIEEIRQNLNRSHRAWSFQGKKTRHFAHIDLAQDAHGGWWAAWHWSIHTIPDSYTGTIGGGGPKDYAGRSKHRALIDALNAINTYRKAIAAQAKNSMPSAPLPGRIWAPCCARISPRSNAGRPRDG